MSALSGAIGVLDGFDMTREEFETLVSVFREMRRAVAKHGDQSHVPAGTGPEVQTLGRLVSPNLPLNLTVSNRIRRQTDIRFQRAQGTWADILLEEVFEAFAEEDHDALVEELTQVAAMALAWLTIERNR